MQARAQSLAAAAAAAAAAAPTPLSGLIYNICFHYILYLGKNKSD